MANIKKSLESKTIDNLFKINSDICFILGCSQSLLDQFSKKFTEDQKKTYDWIIQAIENVIYLDKRLPKILS